MAVGSIEGNPVFIVSTEADVWSVSSDDYISGVPLVRLIEQLNPDQHVYLVHLDSRRPDGSVKVSDLVGSN